MLVAAPSLRGIARVRRIAWIASGVAGAALVAFHGWVLASQFAAGRLAEPGLAFRWIVAAGVAAALVGLQRSGTSLVGRKNVALWLLAALLHGPAVAAASADRSGTLALPEAIATVVVQIAVTSGSLALGLWILGRLLADSRHRSVLRLAPAVSAVRLVSDPNRRPFSPRPPPHI